MTENAEHRRSPNIPLRHIPSTLSGTQGTLHRQLSDGMRASNNLNYKNKKTLPLIGQNHKQQSVDSYHRQNTHHAFMGKGSSNSGHSSIMGHSFTVHNSNLPSQTQLHSYNGTGNFTSTMGQSPSTFRGSESPQPIRHGTRENNQNLNLVNNRVSGGTIWNSGKKNLKMFTETDGFSRQSVNKLSNIVGSNQHLIRKPSDLKMPALPNINRYPSRAKVHDYSPTYQSKHRMLQPRGSKEFTVSGSGAVKIIDLQSNIMPKEKNIVYMQNGRIDQIVLKNHQTLKEKSQNHQILLQKPKTPNQIYGATGRLNTQYFDKPSISSYRKNMTPLINYGSSKLAVKPLKSTTASNYQGIQSKSLRRTGRDFRRSP